MTPTPVGPATLAGLLTAISGFAGAIIAFVVKSPGDQQALGTIVSAGIGMAALAVTMVGRYTQANNKIKAVGPPVSPPNAITVIAPTSAIPDTDALIDALPTGPGVISPITVGDQTTLAPQFTGVPTT
jgi:hypothetical protein